MWHSADSTHEARFMASSWLSQIGLETSHSEQATVKNLGHGVQKDAGTDWEEPSLTVAC